MTRSLKIALVQANPTVGAVAENLDLVRAARQAAAQAGADIAVFSELVVSGYPPEDLVLRPAFLDRIESEVEALAAETADGGPAVILGAPWRVEGKRCNAALVLDGGKIAAVVRKHHLPNYGVFDEVRVFAPGPLPEPVEVRGARLGVMVCEDMWFPDVASHLKLEGAGMLVVLNGSPYEMDKPGVRLRHAQDRVAETGLPLVYVNQIGGQDGLVFDGGSFVLDADGAVAGRMTFWESAQASSEWIEADGRWTPAPLPECAACHATPDEEIYRAMMLGLRDYVNKNGFPGVILGLSGGIDSALSAAVAVDALGPERVKCVMMPSPYTSAESLEDAEQAAGMLGVDLSSVPIGPAMEAFDAMLAPVFEGREADTTEENIQARSRGIVLMALSNKFGHMLLTTGNKSEMSVGYATLYGDMAGGYSVLKDVYKTAVFHLSRWRNAQRPGDALGPDGPVMPERIITKPPSAELKPGQTDQDSLPPYDLLDAVLECLIEQDLSIAETVARGFDEAVVRRVWTMLNRAEYKRRQAPPGVKITSRTLERDRRYPLTNAYKEQG